MASIILSNLLATLKSTFRINRATLDASGLSAARTVTLPDASFTVAGYFAATQRMLGRNTGGAGGAEEVTVSQVLDWMSSTRGTILYRGASGWAALAPGTAGHFLKTNGAGADPSWESIMVDLTAYHLVSAGTTNATVVKASAGKLYGWFIQNNNASMRKLTFHNSASTPTAGASVLFTLKIPGSGAANVLGMNPVNFSSGIAITTTTDLADNGTTAVAANDLDINLFYA